ncbi:MAG: hypothetical protein ACP6IY_22595, partial [Promethearchaeia archaeon]
VQIFNFLTIILPIIIYDFVYIIYKIIKKSFSFPSRSKIFKKNLLSLVIIITLGFFILYFRIFKCIFENSAYFSEDPYIWAYNVLYLLENETLENNLSTYYPQGFTFYCAGNLLLIFPDFEMIYFFMKFGFFIIIIFYLILIYIISNQIFKDYQFFFGYFCVIITLGYNYLLYRSILFLPSLLANLLILICILIIITKIPNYFLGIIIPTIYLIHNLSLFFLLLNLIIFYIIKLIKCLKDLKDKKMLKNLFEEIIKIIFLTFILLIPYIIHLYIKFNVHIIKIISDYYNILIKISLNDVKNIQFPNKINLLLIINNDLDLYVIFKINSLKDFYYISIGPFLIFALFGMFINSKNEENENFFSFLKIGFILIIIIFYILNFFIENNYFYSFAKFRILENFSFIIIFLSVIFIEWLFDKLNKLWNYYKIKNKKVKIKKINNRRFRISFLSLLFISLSIFSLIYVINREEIPYRYQNRIFYNENIIYINKHIPKGSHIGVRNLTECEESNSPHNLLYNYKLYYYSKKNHSQYYNFLEFCLKNDIDYIIFKLTFFNESNRNLFLNSSYFELVYKPLQRDWLYGVYKFRP